MSSIYVDQAVQAFREVERAKLLLEKKEQALSNAVLIMANSVGMNASDAKDREEYVRLTNEILAEYEVKREKAGLSA